MRGNSTAKMTFLGKPSHLIICFYVFLIVLCGNLSIYLVILHASQSYNIVRVMLHFIYPREWCKMDRPSCHTPRIQILSYMEK